MAKLLAKVLSANARAIMITVLTGMITWRKVVNVVTARVLLQLNLPTVVRPQPVFLLLLTRRSVVAHRFFGRNVGRFFLSEIVHLQKIHNII